MADGTILVGVPGDDTGASDAGAAYLFDASGTLLRTLLDPTPNTSGDFGRSLAIANGYVLVGNPGDDRPGMIGSAAASPWSERTS